MGYAYLLEKLPGDLTRQQVRRAFEDLRERDRVAYGTRSYTGSWKEVSFLSLADSKGRDLRRLQEDVYDELEKGSAVAMLTRDAELSWHPTPASVVPLREAWDAAGKALTAHVDGVVARLKAAKSATKGCAACGSSIAVSHLRVGEGKGRDCIPCPVCGAADFAMSAGDRERKATLAAKVAAAKAAEEAEVARLRKAAERPVWALFGCASC